MKILHGWIAQHERFDNASTQGIRVLRIGVAGILLLQLGLMLGDIQFLYLGGLSRPEVLSAMPILGMISQWTSLSAPSVLAGVFLVYGAALLGILLNEDARPSAAIALVSHLIWVNSAPFSTYGVDTFARFALFSLCFASGRPRPGGQARLMGLVTMFLAIVYGSAGVHKALGPEWWSGESIHRMLYFQHPEWGTAFAQMPWLLQAFSIGTVLLDLLWPVLIAFRPTRQPLLLVTILMHLGILASLHLVSFAGIMIVLNAAVLTASVAQEGWVLPRLRRNRHMVCERMEVNGV